MAFDFFGYHGDAFPREIHVPKETSPFAPGNVSGGVVAPADAWGNFAPYKPGDGPLPGQVFDEYVFCAGGTAGCLNVYKWSGNE